MFGTLAKPRSTGVSPGERKATGETPVLRRAVRRGLRDGDVVQLQDRERFVADQERALADPADRRAVAAAPLGRASQAQGVVRRGLRAGVEGRQVDLAVGATADD